jgi:hypothetical protein
LSVGVARYSDIIFQARLLRAEAAGQYVGCPGLLIRMVRAAWIKAAVRRKKMTLYRRSDLDQCLDRIDRGEFPEEAE